MRKIFQLTALLMLGLFGACSEDALDDLSGKYDIGRNVYTEVINQTTDKLRKGVKQLNIMLADEAGKQWDLRIGSNDWILQGGIFQAKVLEKSETDENLPKEALTAGTLYSIVEKDTIVSGDLEVTLLGDTYYLDGLFQGKSGKQYACDYKGAISFTIGVDDPEASGYTAVLSTQPVYLTDATGQVTGVVPGVTKYSFAVSDPDGKAVASFDLVNSENLTVAALAGNYTVTGTSEAGSMDAGNALPADWGGASWGSYFIEKDVKQFIAGGTLVISAATGTEGETLLSFTGQGLDTTLGMDTSAVQIPGTSTEFNIRFVTVSQSGAE